MGHKEKYTQKNKSQLTRKVKKNVPTKNIQIKQKNKSLHTDKSEYVSLTNEKKRKIPPPVPRKQTKISMLIKITNHDGIGIRKYAEYPGKRTGTDVSFGQILKCSERKFYTYQNHVIRFYKLSDGRGWIHNFRRRNPNALNGLKEINSEYTNRKMNPNALDGLKDINSEYTNRKMKILEVGTAVTLMGLKKATKYNGKVGHICTLYNLAKKKYGVELVNGKILPIQPANITILEEKAKNKGLNKIDSEPTTFTKAKKITNRNSRKRKMKIDNDEIHTKGERTPLREDDKKKEKKT